MVNIGDIRNVYHRRPSTIAGASSCTLTRGEGKLLRIPQIELRVATTQVVHPSHFPVN